MPINADLISGLRSGTPIVDPLEQVSRGFALKGQMQQSQLAEQAFEQNAREMERQSRADEQAAAELAAQQAEDDLIRDTLASHSGNLGTALPELGKKVRAKTYLNLRKMYADEQKERAEYDAKLLPVRQYQNERLAALTGTIDSMSDEELAAQWPTIAAQAKEIDPELPVPEAPPDRKTLKLFHVRFLTQAQLDKEAAEKRAIELHGSAVKKAEADAAKAQTEAEITDATKAGMIAAAPDPATGLTPQQVAALEAGKYTSDQRDYDRAVKDGAIDPKKTSFVDYQRIMANLKAPKTTVTVNNAAEQRAAPVIGQIKELSKRINTGEGLAATATGILRSGAAKVNYDNDVAQYERLVEGAIPLVARAMGHTGVLTQQDVDSVRAMFPKPGDSKELSEALLRQVDAILNSNSTSTTLPGGVTLEEINAEIERRKGNK